MDKNYLCRRINNSELGCCKPEQASDIKIKNRSEELGFPLCLLLYVISAGVTLLLAFKVYSDRMELKKYPKAFDAM